MLVVGYCITLGGVHQFRNLGSLFSTSRFCFRLSRIAYLHDTHLDRSLGRCLGSQPVA